MLPNYDRRIEEAQTDLSEADSENSVTSTASVMHVSSSSGS